MTAAKTNPDMAFMLGGIQSDVKHILDALSNNQQELEAVEGRLNKVEKFQVRVATAIALLTPVVAFGSSWIITLLT